MDTDSVHHFAFGLINPMLAYALAFMGSSLGLTCTARARAATSAVRRRRWLVIASLAIGGGIWLMHFMAMLGFQVTGTPLRYHSALTATSALMAAGVVSAGLLAVSGSGRPSIGKVVVGGVFTGSGVAAMHYTGMAALSLSGHLTYDASLVAASVILAIVAAIVALWLSVAIQGRWPIIIAAAVMALAVCVMHYTGMAAVRVHLDENPQPVSGVNAIELGLPITLIAAAALIGLMFTALHTLAQEDAVLPTGLSAPTDHGLRPRAIHPTGIQAYRWQAPVPARRRHYH